MKSEDSWVCPDLALAYQEHRAEIDGAIQKVLAGGCYILGEEVEAFENEFAAYLGARYGIGVASGTDALILGLKACGVGPGDEVLAPSFTAVATIAAIEACGANPVLVDIDGSYTIDLNQLEDYLRSQYRKSLKAVVPVHLFGWAVDMDALTAIAGAYDLRVIEDCAQAHGAQVSGKKVGAWGDVGAFSFYPTKNLGCLGDGGVIVTNQADLADKVHLLRQYGWKKRFVSEITGLNSRLDEIQAAVLRVKLKYLGGDNARRLELAKVYDEGLKDLTLSRPALVKDGRHVYHQYVIRCKNRNALMDHLEKNRIRVAVHYPAPVHLQPAYKSRLKTVGVLEKSAQFSTEVISLPLFAQLSVEKAMKVVRVIQDFAEV